MFSIFKESDPGLSSCVMLAPERSLSDALHLLHETFRSPQVAVGSFIESVCNGSPIANTEVGLPNFYSDLINCKIALKAVEACNLLNAASTAERIFLRLPNAFQEVFVKLAAKSGFDLDALPFDLFIKHVENKHKSMCSRFGQLLQRHNHRIVPRANLDHKVKANQVQTAQEGKKLLLCFCCGCVEHRIALCESFLKLSRPDRKVWYGGNTLCFNCVGCSHRQRTVKTKVIKVRSGIYLITVFPRRFV